MEAVTVLHINGYSKGIFFHIENVNKFFSMKSVTEATQATNYLLFLNYWKHKFSFKLAC